MGRPQQLIALLAALLLLSAPAMAQDAHFTCTSGFSMTKTDDGYLFSGKLETPTPGYRYDISDVKEIGDGAVSGTLRLTAPDGMVIQVLDSIEISYALQREAELSKFTLNIEKSFGWGASGLSCDATQ